MRRAERPNAKSCSSFDDSNSVPPAQDTPKHVRLIHIFVHTLFPCVTHGIPNAQSCSSFDDSNSVPPAHVTSKYASFIYLYILLSMCYSWDSKHKVLPLIWRQQQRPSYSRHIQIRSPHPYICTHLFLCVTRMLLFMCNHFFLGVTRTLFSVCDSYFYIWTRRTYICKYFSLCVTRMLLSIWNSTALLCV